MDKLTARNINIVKDQVIATQEPFLSVTADIYEGETFLENKKYGFAFTMSKEEIVAEIAKSLTTYRSEKEQAEKNKERDALESQADEAIEHLSGLEIIEPEK